MKKTKFFLVLGILVFLLVGLSQADCGDCFKDAAPYIQVNYKPPINWGDENVNVCPGGTITYNPGDPLYLSYGLWDQCEEYRGAPQKVCGEFFIVVADNSLQHFLYFSQNSWHLTTSVEEIKPYIVIGPEGSTPFVWSFSLPEGVNLPPGTYHLIAFVDKVADQKPSFDKDVFKYCVLDLFVP